MKFALTLCSLTLVLSQLGLAQTKPLILISGNGNLSISSTGQGVAGGSGSVGWAAGASQTAINKHDQTMEMAEDFSNFCPAVELTLSQAAQPDYFVFLNREGHPTGLGELGQSQVMVLNKRKTVIFVVGKKAIVKNAVKNACNAIAADWQANGRIAVDIPTAVPISQAPAASFEADIHTAATLPETPKRDTVAIVLRTTASADKYCKPETIASVLSDTNAYMTSKGLIQGTTSTAKTTLVLIVNRPMSKWVEITVQGRDVSGNVLWSEKASDGGWGHLGTQGLLNTTEKVHQILDSHFK